MEITVENSNCSPYVGSGQSAGLDLRAKSSATVSFGEITAVETGVRVAIPDGHVGLLFARSGLAAYHGVRLVNSVGVIDSDYRGEIVAAMTKDTPGAHTINPGDRIAQLVVIPILSPLTWETTFSLDETERGEDGFGSTGVS